MPKVNHEVLVWARESIGFSVEEAARKINLRDGVRASAVDKLTAIETGKKKPSRPQLLKMSHQYRKPLLSLYMREPPTDADRGKDFRTLPDGLAREDNVFLDVLIRDVQARQSLLRETLIQEDEAEPIPFIGTLEIQQSIGQAANMLRKLLGFDLEQFRDQKTVDDAFKYARKAVEARGVFVLLVGNLGSHHTNISTNTFRGFALADDVAPFIVINDQDARSAWSFTLLHEMVHLLLAQTGVSNVYAENQIERFCNDVASEILLPAIELKKLARAVEDADDLTNRITEFTTPRKISGRMVAYRLLRSNRITQQAWRQLDAHMNNIWLEMRRRQKEANRDNNSNPNYYIVRRHKLGNSLINTAQRMMSSGALTATRAGFLLGVKPIKLHRLFQSATTA